MVEKRTKMIVQHQRVQNILFQGLNLDQGGASECSYEYLNLVNKLRSYLEPLVELHRAKVN